MLDEAIRRAYKILGNHRAVAARLKLPLHEVMFTLGLLPAPVYAAVNAHPYVTECRTHRRRVA